LTTPLDTPADVKEKINFINTGAIMCNITERSYEESKIGGGSSMMGD